MVKVDFHSLTYKISTFIVVIMTVSLLVFSAVFIVSERSKALESIVKGGEIFANFSANVIYDNFVQFYTHPKEEDFANFKTNVQNILANDKDVIRVSLVGVNGRILFDSDEFVTGKYSGPGRSVSDAEVVTMLGGDKASYKTITENGSSFTEVVVPLDRAGGHAFAMLYVLSNVSLSDRMSEVYRQILSVVIPLILFAILFAVFFTIRLVRPVKHLTGVVETIREGNLDVSGSLEQDRKSKDEIGRLAFAFSEMTVRLKGVYKSLDQKVIELKEEQARLTASINSLAFGFIIVGIDHKVMLRNRAIMDLFGFKEEDQITIKAISEKLGGFNIEEEANRCLKGKNVCEMKEIIFDKKILRGIVAPIVTRDGSEQKIGYVLLLEDITEAKVMERSRDEFFVVASHELRTPLTAIRGNAEMILESFASDIKNPDMKEMLTDIEGASVRLIGIVNDFLEVSSFEQGKVAIKTEPTDVSAIIEKVVKDLQGMAAKRNVVLKYDKPAEPLPLVMAEKGRVEQVLMNLIGNSLKFTEKGEITITFAKKNDSLKVTVADTGLGISDKYQSRLFRKFQQAGEDMIARDVTQGTGLGLYICQLIVNAMGGTIELEKSELGKGSTFAFTLLIAK